MSFEEFQATLENTVAPTGLSPALMALWHDARGDWESAHRVAQDDPSSEGAWVHAYLHRKEGDFGNAGYWYARGGRLKAPKDLALDIEWAAIARELLARLSRLEGARFQPRCRFNPLGLVPVSF